MKVFGKFLRSCLLCKHPVIEVEDGIVGVEIQLTSFDKNLLWGKVCQHLVDILPVSLVTEEFSCGDIEQGNAQSHLSMMYGTQEVILLVVQDIILQGNTWCDQFCNATFYKFLCQFWIFQLVADGHSPACSYQFWEVCIQRMMWKTSHCIAL